MLTMSCLQSGFCCKQSVFILIQCLGLVGRRVCKIGVVGELSRLCSTVAHDPVALVPVAR